MNLCRFEQDRCVCVCGWDENSTALVVSVFHTVLLFVARQARLSVSARCVAVRCSRSSRNCHKICSSMCMYICVRACVPLSCARARVCVEHVCPTYSSSDST